jgi:adenylate cyclase
MAAQALLGRLWPQALGAGGTAKLRPQAAARPGIGEKSLPERVRQAIRRQQDESEMLIGWLQLAVGLTFASLYLVSPKTGPEFDLVPWTLSIYLGLTVVRLVWGRRARLPDWSLAGSVVFDMTLLMILIWSFHLKYGQPPSFYLKAPTLLYVFIFIALRALRFEVRFVLLAGIVAALSWGALILFALADAGQTVITRNYVTYLTSNSVLIGGEIDKILSILAVTAILGFALHRARRLLVRAVVEQTAAHDLSRFFAPEIAAKITASEHRIRAGTAEPREAAILNLDLRGFTRYAAEANPDAVMMLLSEYQALMVPVIRKHGGRVDKFLGDGILATFGAVQSSQTYAADGLRALDALMAEARSWAESCRLAGRFCPTVNGALATGRVLFGAVGDDERLEYTVIGEAVNLSAKLEKANKDLGTSSLCDLATYELARQQGYLPPAPKTALPAVAVPGLVRSLDLVRISP